MPSRGGLTYYITADCGRPNCPALWFKACLPNKTLWIFNNDFLSQRTSKLFRIKCIFMKIMQQHYQSNIIFKEKGITENKVDYVYVMVCS